MLLQDANSIGHFSDLEIRRAIAHHRRAIRALHDRDAFTGIKGATSEKVIKRLQKDLSRLHDELGRRRMRMLTQERDSQVNESEISSVGA